MYAKKDFSFTNLGKTLIINFPHQNDEKSVLFVVSLKDAIKAKYADYIEDITTTFNSINLFFKSSYDKESIVVNLLKIIDKTPYKLSVKTRKWKLPVCVDDEFTKDISSFFKGNQQKIDWYLTKFFDLQFRFVFYGFLPGFPYLSGLPANMAIARKSTPNNLTPKGSVAIGGNQVGIYPQNSPGGWHVIGNCPFPIIEFYSADQSSIIPGDQVQFYKISKPEYVKVLEALKTNSKHTYLKTNKDD